MLVRNVIVAVSIDCEFGHISLNCKYRKSNGALGLGSPCQNNGTPVSHEWSSYSVC